MGDVNYSDRVWCTFLWEMMRYVENRLQDTADLEESLKGAIQTGFLPVEDMTAEQLANPIIIRIIHATAPALFLRFLRENSEILNPDAVVSWVRDRQPRYPDDQINRLIKGAPDK